MLMLVRVEKYVHANSMFYSMYLSSSMLPQGILTGRIVTDSEVLIDLQEEEEEGEPKLSFNCTPVDGAQ